MGKSEKPQLGRLLIDSNGVFDIAVGFVLAGFGGIARLNHCINYFG